MSTDVKKKTLHPVCVLMRELRQATGLSLVEAGQQMGLNAVLLGSYERGDRTPPLTKVEFILKFYGYTVAAKPARVTAVRLPVDIVTTLHAIADQLAGQHRIEPVVEMPAEHQGHAASIW